MLTDKAGALFFRFPPPESESWKRLGLPGSWMNPYARALFSDPGRTQDTRPLRRLSTAAACYESVGSH